MRYANQIVFLFGYLITSSHYANHIFVRFTLVAKASTFKFNLTVIITDRLVNMISSSVLHFHPLDKSE